jgi:hypothetical protein
MKFDEQYQKSGAQVRDALSGGSVWVCYSDQATRGEAGST